MKVQCSEFVVDNVLPLLQGGDLVASLDDVRLKLVDRFAELPMPAAIIFNFDGYFELPLNLLCIGAKEISRYHIAELTVLDGELVKSDSFDGALNDYFTDVDPWRHYAFVDVRALRFARSV